MRTHNVDGYKFQEKYENNRIQKSKQRDVQEKNEIKKRIRTLALARINNLWSTHIFVFLSISRWCWRVECILSGWKRIVNSIFSQLMMHILRSWIATPRTLPFTLSAHTKTEIFKVRASTPFKWMNRYIYSAVCVNTLTTKKGGCSSQPAPTQNKNHYEQSINKRIN